MLKLTHRGWTLGRLALRNPDFKSDPGYADNYVIVTAVCGAAIIYLNYSIT